MSALLATSIVLLAARATPGSVTRYDQSQQGEYNVQLELKNVEVYAVLGETAIGAGGEVYDYDYGELTIKPPPPLPSTMGNTTTEAPVLPGGMWGSSIASLGNTTSPNPNSSTSSYSQHSSSSPPMPLPTTITEALVTSTARSTRRCGAGFFRDNFGRCRRIRRPHKPASSTQNGHPETKHPLPLTRLRDLSALFQQ